MSLAQCSGTWEQTVDGLLSCTGEISAVTPWWQMEMTPEQAGAIISAGVLLMATSWVVVQIGNSIKRI